jgi:hypothetical protein
VLVETRSDRKWRVDYKGRPRAKAMLTPAGSSVYHLKAFARPHFELNARHPSLDTTCDQWTACSNPYYGVLYLDEKALQRLSSRRCIPFEMSVAYFRQVGVGPDLALDCVHIC